MPLLVSPPVPAGSWGRRAQPVLWGPGLVLRAWEPRDAAFLVTAYADPEIQRWHVRSLTHIEAEEWIAARGIGWRGERCADWAVEVDGEPAGRVGFTTLNLGEGRGEVSYWVAPERRRRGVAVRAVTTLCEWALGAGGLHRVDLLHSVANTASCRVAERAGFAVEGTAVSSVWHQDGWHDMHVHARLGG